MKGLKLQVGSALLLCALSASAGARAQAYDGSVEPSLPTASGDGQRGNERPAAPPSGETPPPPQEQDQDAIAIQAELLHEQFQKAAEGSKKARTFAGLAGVTGGVILLGLGAWRLAEDPEDSQYSRGLGVMFTTLGMVDLTTGIIAFKRLPHEEERAKRYEKDLQDGMSAIELARYEGEFDASARIRESQRMLVRWNGFTHALAGAIVIGFAAIPDMDAKSRRSAYVIGGVFMGAGAVSFGLSFKETPNERAWSNYQKQKQETPGLSQQVSVAPVISRHSFGLGLSGRF